MEKVDLSKFTTGDFSKGAGAIKMTLWYFTNSLFFKSSLFPMMKFKSHLLRLFGAKVGVRLIVKPCVNVKFPWKLIIGDDVWLGENVWIDNLDNVSIGSNVCLSQGALLLTGNHDYTITNMPYRNAPILIEDGVWIGAQTVVCSGVKCKSHSILTAGSVATKDMEEYTIYQGNPAVEIRKRRIK